MSKTDGSSSRRKREESSCSHEIIPDLARPTTFIPLLQYSEAKDCGLDYYLAAMLDEAPPEGRRANGAALT